MKTPQQNRIYIGDCFQRKSGKWEVIGLKPGGRVELFEREKCMFMDKFTNEVRTWERLIKQ